MARNTAFRNRARYHTPNRDPLRKIVGYQSVRIADGADKQGVYINKEELECGHLVFPKTDITGHETNAVRRRCWQCRKEQEEQEAFAETNDPADQMFDADGNDLDVSS